MRWQFQKSEVFQRYGPFSLAAIPIGEYEPRAFMKYVHVNPEEAVQIHVDIRYLHYVGRK